ncbi:MAG: ferrochelatase [Bacteroidota bacterium]
MKKQEYLIVNLGTPNGPTRKDIKKYLTEFLIDGRAIDLPAWKRTLFVKGVIAPFRSMKVAKEYKKLWLPKDCL